MTRSRPDPGPAELLMVGFEGPGAPPHLLDLIDQGLAGLVLFGRNAGPPADLEARLDPLQRRAARAGWPPLLVSIDHEGGRVQRLRDGYTGLPPAMALGAAGDPALAYRLARLAAAELRPAGVNMILGPCADLQSNPANPVIGVRAFGDDPAGVSRLVAPTVRGYQDGGLLAVAKHFPGHGDTHQDSHHTLPRLERSRERFRQEDLVPFRAALAEGVAAVMSAHIVVPWLDGERPVTLSRRALTGLLRGELGFDGLIMTDCMEMRAITDHYQPEEATLAALRAGADLVLWSHTPAWQVRAWQAVRARWGAGGREAGALRAAAGRVRAARERAGALGAGAAGRTGPGPGVALEAWRRSVTLIHDRGRLLPLARGREVTVAGGPASGEDIAAAVAALVDELAARGVPARPPGGRGGPAPPGAAIWLLSDRDRATGPAAGDTDPGPGSILVATGLPYGLGLDRYPAAGAVLATYSPAGGAMRALAEALAAGPEGPGGRLPVRLR